MVLYQHRTASLFSHSIPLLHSILQNQLNKNLFSICFIDQDRHRSFVTCQLVPSYLAIEDNLPYTRWNSLVFISLFLQSQAKEKKESKNLISLSFHYHHVIYGNIFNTEEIHLKCMSNSVQEKNGAYKNKPN